MATPRRPRGGRVAARSWSLRRRGYGPKNTRRGRLLGRRVCERRSQARTALNAALSGAKAKKRIEAAASQAARSCDAATDDAYALTVARLALRAALFGGDDDAATAFLGPAELASTPPPPPPPPFRRRRARLRVAARQARVLARGAPFFEVVDAFTNVDAKVTRARFGAGPPRAAVAAARSMAEARRVDAVAAGRAGFYGDGSALAALYGEAGADRRPFRDGFGSLRFVLRRAAALARVFGHSSEGPRRRRGSLAAARA